MTPDAKTAKSELTRSAIIGASLDLVATEGLNALTLQAVADRVGLSKSGVFSRVGSLITLQKAVLEEFGRRFLADVFVPAMQRPKGLARLDAIVERWFERLARPEPNNSCIYSAAAFELDDRDGELRDFLLLEIMRWRSALRRAVLHSVETGQLRADTVPEQLVSEIYGLAMGLLLDIRFLRDSSALARAAASWQRLRASYLP